MIREQVKKYVDSARNKNNEDPLASIGLLGDLYQ